MHIRVYPLHGTLPKTPENIPNLGDLHPAGRALVKLRTGLIMTLGQMWGYTAGQKHPSNVAQCVRVYMS